MSSEACPFCGKLFKRLKTHLPHCKATPHSKTPPRKHNDRAFDSVAVSAPTQKVKDVLASSSGLLQSSSSLRITSPSTEKKLKSTDQLETTTSDHLETTTSLLPPLSNLTVRKPRKKNLRASIEAGKSNQLAGGRPEDPHAGSPQGLKADKESLQLISVHSKHKDVLNRKVKSKKASQFLETEVDECNTRAVTRGQSWVKDNNNVDGSFTVKLNSQVLISLQNVKTRLGCPDGVHLLEHADIQKSRMGQDVVKQIDVATAAALLEQLQSLVNEHAKSKQPHSIQLQGYIHAQLQAPYDIAGHLHPTAVALNQSSSPPSFTFPPQSPPSRAEMLQLQADKQNSAERLTEATQTQRSPSLGQVTLRELPEWLACRTPGHPREVVEMFQRGWQWYYTKYIHVKKGGSAGIGMLLVGYCVLSYIWMYPRTKRDRWRKYH